MRGARIARDINYYYVCKDTILVDPVLVSQVLALKVPHNELFVEYRLKNLVPVSLNGLLHGLRGYRNKNKRR